MPDQILVDTGFVLALINTRDKYHAQALELGDRYEGFPLLVTTAVLLEIGNALARGFKEQAVAVIERFLNSDEVEVVQLSSSLFEKAFALYRQYQDKDWGMVDCVSIVVMRDAGIRQALAFDNHFSQAGFEVLIPEEK